MSLPEITSQEQWLTARKELLAREKQLTRLRDELNADRRRLPMVAVSKEYVFEGANGKATLLDLFDGKRQLVLQHVMFGPDWDAACPGCTAGLDELADGVLEHLRSRDTAFVGVSRAPYSKLAAYAGSRGWRFPWYSSFGSDFNYDFHATLDESVAPVEYNFRTRDEHVVAGSGDDRMGVESDEMPGVSCFLRDGDRVFHTYATWARGTDQLGSAYSFLDLTAMGRQEEWEEPKGRAVRTHGADPTFTD
ncbi:MAG TPA: DUF899 domain-containing protein [Pseudonocardiaceae bacterium]|jgi:predicted dithiol-disulfide oxidoreductase (DUF899 family)|nr:DUF899 domain-containing protein [Pseudonocardiaceae bacterium]